MLTRRIVLGGAMALPFTAYAQARGVVVFGAASLKEALDDIAAAWAKETGKTLPRGSYAASSALARQIEQGAPADIFLSADQEWMDYLADRKLIRPETRTDLLGNRIVLIAAKDSRLTLDLAPGVDLAGALGGGRLAMGNVDAVPAGKYGKAALEKLGVWNSVKGRVAQAENVRAALLLVSRGEAPLGIVYRTDAAADANVRVVATFPEASHPPIVYSAAVIADSQSAEAAGYLAYLRGATARVLFERRGFGIVNP